MVEQLQRYGIFNSKKVAETMEKVDRALFVPDRTPAYVDSPMAIGYNVTISAPHMHAMCLQLLEKNLQPGMHALDIGSGFMLILCLGIMSTLICTYILHILQCPLSSVVLFL